MTTNHDMQTVYSLSLLCERSVDIVLRALYTVAEKLAKKGPLSRDKLFGSDDEGPWWHVTVVCAAARDVLGCDFMRVTAIEPLLTLLRGGANCLLTGTANSSVEFDDGRAVIPAAGGDDGDGSAAQREQMLLILTLILLILLTLKY
jgi:hypothetical protein